MVYRKVLFPPNFVIRACDTQCYCLRIHQSAAMAGLTMSLVHSSCSEALDGHTE